MGRLVFFNGNVITLSSITPKANAIAVDGDRITYVGSNEEALAGITDNVERIDLKGMTLIPGFNDNHMHATGLGITSNSLSLRGLDADKIVAALKDRFGNEKENVLIIANNWDYPDCPNPHKSILDDAFPDNPVILSQFGGHGLWANSLALKKMKLGPRSANPPNGEIMRDTQGQLTGVVREVMTNSYLRKQYFRNFFNKRVIEDSLRIALDEYRSAGLTTVQDNTWFFKTVNVLNMLRSAGELTCRFSCWFFGEIPLLAFLMNYCRFDESWIHRGPWKHFLDGTFTTKTAWLTEPYSNEENNYGKGKDRNQIMRIMLPSIRKRRQAAFHAIGDRTISEFIDAVELLRKQYPRTVDLRFRLEHAQLIRKEDMPRLKENGICIASQPAALTTPEKDANLLGPARALNAYPYRSLLDEGVHLSFGSDFPGEPVFKPLEIIHLAVNRDGPERISPLEALKCYTQGSAYVEDREHEKGSIETGKLADFTVLSDDLTTIEPLKIQNISVEKTIVGGNMVYERKLNTEPNIPAVGDKVNALR